MLLGAALNHLSTLEPNSGRQKVLAETLKNPEKLAKTNLRIEFLTACRKENVVPRFIQDSLRPVTSIFTSNDRVLARSSCFAKTLLNETIAESFRKKAYLERERSRLFELIGAFLDRYRFNYISQKCQQIFEQTIYENRNRLIRKFRLLKEKSRNNQSQGQIVNAETNKRVNNLSSQGLSEACLSVLAKGPNFAMTQCVTKEVLLDVAKGVERFAYAKRWKDKITGPSGATRTPSEDVTDAGAPTTVSAEPAVPTPQPSGGTTPTASDNGTLGNSSVAVSPGEGVPQQRAGRFPNLSFRFPDTGKTFPEPSSRDVETSLQKLKDDLLRTYKSHKVANKNVTTEQYDSVLELAKNKDVIVKQSDKCKGFVILEKETYLDKAKTILDDPQSYEKLSKKNPIPKVEAKTKRTLKSITRGKLPDRTITELTPAHSRTPVFYGLPKDHKPSVPLRPVISACGGPTEKTSCLLERILNQLLRFVPTHIWDTKDFLNRLSHHSQSVDIPSGSIFFSIDVVNLYGNIPVHEAIAAVETKLDNHAESIDTFGLTKDDISELLKQCLGDNVFSFGDQYYRQKLGLAMGNPCAPALAILFLDQFETSMLATCPIKPEFLIRYLDDYAGIFSHGQEALDEFLSYMNSRHPHLKFTMEHTGGGSGVPYLDTLVTLETSGENTTIETELYIKPTNSGIILHSTSAHPTSTKHNIVRNMFHRAMDNSSSVEKERKSVDKIWNLLLKNGYNSGLLRRMLREVRLARTGNGRRRKAKEGSGSYDGFLTLPYIDEQLLCKIKKVVKRSNLKIHVAWKNNQKLKSSLIRSAISKPKCPGGRRCHLCKSGFKGDCTQKNVVYQIECRLCKQDLNKAQYVGESMRPVRLRFNEHLCNAKNRTVNTPLGDHVLQKHTAQEIQAISEPLELKVIHRARDHADRKIAESIIIQDRQPSLNTQGTSWPIMRV